MLPLATAIFIFTLGLGTTMVFASSHWLLAWIGLEMNTLAVVPLMIQTHNPRAVEAAMKYFISQATASSLLLFATITNACFMGQWEIQQITHPLAIILITCALAFKMGLAPMHAWVPEVLQGLDLTTGLILLTWQKLAPFILLIQIQPHSPILLIIFATLSLLVGGWAGLAQLQLRKLLAYSSIAHLGWMIIITQFSPTLALFTLFTYITLTTPLFLLLKINNSTTMNTFAFTLPKHPTLMALTSLLLLSLAGLPPLSGFGPKLLILLELINQELPLLAMFSAFAGLLTLYYYLRLVYNLTLIKTPNSLNGTPLWLLTPMFSTLPLSITLTLALAALPLLPSLLAIFPY